MENRELIYEMAKRLDMVIEVTKAGEYKGRYRFFNDKLYKLKDNEDKQHDNNEKKEMRELRET